MARKVRNSSLESRSSRLKLKVRRKPFTGPSLARGIMLLYRRNKGNGTWVLKAADGHGKYKTKAIGLADDYEDSDGKKVLTFYEAQDSAKRLARGGDGVAELLNLDTALTRWEADLTARGSRPYNAQLVRHHLTGSTLAITKLLALISADELKAWRNALIAKGLAASSVNRVRNNLRAALELAMPSRSHVWKEGLETLPNATRARKLMIYPDKVISALVAEAYKLDAQLGLLCDVLATTGTRPIQAQRLRIEDLIADAQPRLMMSKSAKGGGRNRSSRKSELFPVPVTADLCAKLRMAAQGRADDAPLLTQSDGRPWNEANPNADYRLPFAEVVKAVGLPARATAYLFRHSSITRLLLRGLHTKLVADLHDTSEQMIRQHYGKYIVEHTDEIARAALLHHEPSPAADNVIVLPRR
jgi:hypothetical protein